MENRVDKMFIKNDNPQAKKQKFTENGNKKINNRRINKKKQVIHKWLLKTEKTR